MMNRSPFGRYRFLLLALVAAVLAVPITWTLFSFVYPSRIPVSLELASPSQGQVQLRWGDTPQQAITLMPDKEPARHRLEVIASGGEGTVRVEGLWDEKGRPIPLTEINFAQGWKVLFNGMVALTGSPQPARLIWQGEAGELTLRLMQLPGTEVHLLWDGVEQPYTLHTQPDLIKFSGVSRHWQGELPPQAIERLWLRLGQDVGQGNFIRLTIGSDPPQVWTAETLIERRPALQGLAVVALNPGLQFQVTAVPGEVELPGFVPLKPAVPFKLAQMFWLWLWLAVPLACIFIIAARVSTVWQRASTNPAERTRLSAIAVRFYDHLLAGRFWSLGFFVFFGFAIFLFLFATIHNRTLTEIYSGVTPRYQQAIMVWIEHGYFKHGSMMFLEPVDVNPTQELYSNSPMSFLQAAHLLQRINYWFTGQYSYRLMSWHNQAFVWFSGALLGLLAMRLARRMGLSPVHTLFLGIACASVYQTFPSSLWNYWEIMPTEVSAMFALLFLLLEEIMFGREQIPRWLSLIRALNMFALFYIDYIATFFFMGTYFVVLLLLYPERLKRLSLFKTMLLPAVLALTIVAIQFLWVRVNYPNLHFFGSTFMFRSGFDGNTAPYVGDHFDLLFGSNRLSSPLYQWKYLFIAGSISILALLGLYLKLPQLKCAVIILAVALGLYVPFAFIFSQATIIHPYMFDVYLVIPMILALFAVLPATLERLTKNPGVIVLLAITLAFCYTMVQIRTYAMAFPLPNSPTGW